MFLYLGNLRQGRWRPLSISTSKSVAGSQRMNVSSLIDGSATYSYHIYKYIANMANSGVHPQVLSDQSPYLLIFDL